MIHAGESTTDSLQSAKRDKVIDYIKCLLILAVVIGHIASRQPGSLDENSLFKWIYSWHMFLFMALGGVILGRYRSSFSKSWLFGRIRRLLIPYFIWTIISLLVNRGEFTMVSILRTLTLEPAYWFLLVQFLYEVFVYVAFNYVYKHRYLFWACLCLFCLFVYYAGASFETLRQFALYAPFYYGGFYLAAEKRLKRIIYSKWICILALFYPVSMLFYTWKDHSYLLSIVQKIFGNHFILTFMDKAGFRLFNHYIVSPLGCIFFSVVVIRLSRFLEKSENKVCRCILQLSEFIGIHTLEIYLMHSFAIAIVMKFMEINMISNCLMFILGLLIPTLTAMVMRYFPRVNALLFGYKIPSPTHN